MVAGQAVVTINGNQWQVSLATTYAELVTGLSGVVSVPAGSGMLFDLGTDQSYIGINMSQMLFPLDIIFINSTQGVVGVLRNVNPGEEAYFQATTTPGARYFVEVNAGEAEGMEVRDSVSIQGVVMPTIFELAIPILIATVIVGGAVATLGKGLLWGIKK